MDNLGVHIGSMDGGLADMRPVYFVLAGKQQDGSFAPFVRISSSNVKSTDLEADPLNGSKSMHIVKTRIPTSTRHLMVQMGEIGNCCSCGCCSLMRNMDQKQYKVNIKHECLLYVSWGQWIRMHLLATGPKVFFFNKSKDMENVGVSGSLSQLGRWAEKEVNQKHIFNVAPGMCIVAASIPHTAQEIEYSLVQVTSLGMIWDSPSQGNKKIKHPGRRDISVYGVWSEAGAYVTEIPFKRAEVIDVPTGSGSERGSLAASLYRLAHMAVPTSPSRSSRGSKASQQDIQNFAAELHDATKDSENDEDTPEEVTKEVVSIHEIDESSTTNTESEQDKNPILEIQRKPSLRKRFIRSMSLKSSDSKKDHPAKAKRNSNAV